MPHNSKAKQTKKKGCESNIKHQSLDEMEPEKYQLWQLAPQYSIIPTVCSNIFNLKNNTKFDKAKTWMFSIDAASMDFILSSVP
jgi:starvation-inducible outer membrane lipoprotein